MKHENMNEYALPFAAWDLRLYLDTHPDDEGALNEYRRICAASGGKCNYACHTDDARRLPHDDNVYGAGNRPAVRDNGCGCGLNSCDSGNGGGGNYGGNRCDGGNYQTRRAENGGCGCNDKGDNHRHPHGGYVWSWVEGPWPWEPEANGGDC